MTTVYFIRHAEPNYDNHDDPSRELSPKGLRDRALVTRFLSGRGVDAVLSSPYKWAIDTVRPFAEANALAIEIDDDFRERRIDSGWIGDFDAFTRAQWADFGYKRPGGESLGEVQRRNIAALRRLLAKYDGRTVAVGSHGTALSTILRYYDPAFGYAQFEAIRPLMPWAVRLAFEGGACVEIESYDLFVCMPG